MQVNDEVAILASGGMDSTVLAYQLLEKHKKIKLIYVNYGQHFIETELGSLKDVMPSKIFDDIKIIDVSTIYTQSKSPLIKKYDLWKEKIEDLMLYVPYRSLVMISSAMAYAQSIGIQQLYAAFIDSNYVKDVDCSSEFFDKFNAVNDMYDGVQLLLPFRYMTKRQVLDLGIQIGAPIALSFSCQVNKDFPCGACPNCVDRANAIKDWEKENIS